jgi:hypothetical protein
MSLLAFREIFSLKSKLALHVLSDGFYCVDKGSTCKLCQMFSSLNPVAKPAAKNRDYYASGESDDCSSCLTTHRVSCPTLEIDVKRLPTARCHG